MPRPEWSPLPHEGCRGVEGKVLVREAGLVVALLRFAPDGTIHEHAAPFPIDVVCLDGEGHVSVGDQSGPIRGGQRTRWPAHARHRAWTGRDQRMVVLMLERLDRAEDETAGPFEGSR